MAPGFAKNLLHKFARAVCDLWLPIEAVIRLDENAEPNNSLDFAEVPTQLVSNDSKCIQRALLGRLLSFLNGHLRGHWPGREEYAICHRELPGDHDEVPRSHRGHIRSHWLWSGGKGDSKMGEGSVWVRHDLFG